MGSVLFHYILANLLKEGAGHPRSLGWGSIISAQKFHQSASIEVMASPVLTYRGLLQVTQSISDMSAVLGICVTQCFQ